MFHQLSYHPNWKPVVMWVDYRPGDDGYRSLNISRELRRSGFESLFRPEYFSGLSPCCLISDKNCGDHIYSFHYLLSKFPLSAFVLNRIIQSYLSKIRLKSCLCWPWKIIGEGSVTVVFYLEIWRPRIKVIIIILCWLVPLHCL